MAKQALLGVLNNTIGKYVANLDAESLNVGIWSGQVELHDLQLDLDACNHELANSVPPIPLQVVEGTFQSLQIEIPWRHLSSKSVVMKAKGLHIQVAPLKCCNKSTSLEECHHDTSKTEEEQAKAVAKQREDALLLANTTREQTNELMKLTELGGNGSSGEGDGSKEQQSAGFVARLVKRIIENLQVDIEDVSVTVLDSNGEDDDDGTGASALGVQLQRLSFVTTDMAGHRSFVDRSNATQQAPSDLLNKFLYKKLDVEGFGIFIDTIGSNSNSTGETKHAYILEPFDLDAKFREADASITHDYPKWLLHSNLPAVHMALTHTQYQQTMHLSQSVNETLAPYAATKPLLFPQYRPLRRPRCGDNAHEWWQYAFRSVCRLTGRRSWSTFYEAFRTRKTYIALYKRQKFAPDDTNVKNPTKTTLSCPWLEPLSIMELAEVDRIESDRTISVDGIMLWRTLAEKQVNKEREKYEAEHGSLTADKPKKGMLSNLFGGKKESDADLSTSIATPIELSTEELKSLEDVGLDELGFAKDLSDTAKLCQLEFKLGELSVNLENASKQPMLGLEMGTVSTTFASDVGGSFEFQYSLTNLEILDHGAQRASSLFPSILKSIPQNNDEPGGTKATEDAFHVHMAKNITGDSKLTVKLIPFEAVVAPHLLSEVMDFVKMPSSSGNSTVEIEEINEEEGRSDDKEANSTLVDKAKEEVKEQSSEYADNFSNALVEAWQEKTKERTSLTIDLDLQAPIIVLPENYTDRHASILVLDLGGFRFRYGSSVESNSKVKRWLEDNTREAESLNLSTHSVGSQSGLVVDYGCLELKNMTFLVGEAGAWRRLSSSAKQGGNYSVAQEAIIEPISVRVDFAVESAVSSSIPRVCLFADIPTSNFKFSPKHLSDTLRVYNAWMQSMASIEALVSSSNTDEPLSQDARSSSRNQALTNVSTMDSADHEVGNIQVEEAHQAIETSLSTDTMLFTTAYVEIALEKYSFAIYDSGDFHQKDDFGTENSMSGSSEPLGNVVEGLVFEGGANLTVEMATNKTRNTSSIETEIQGQNFQIYSGFGRDLRRPLQIMEPVTGKVNLALRNRGNETRTEIEACIINTIDVTFSMRNLALINAISQDVSFRLSKGLQNANDPKDLIHKSLQGLDEEQVQQIEAIELALQGDNEVSTTLVELHNETPEAPKNDTQNITSSVIVINATIPKSKITIINDLQGLDEALFRIKMHEFSTRSKIASAPDLLNHGTSQTIFESKVHWKFLADYYDPSINRWKHLLKEPWELSCRSERARDSNSKRSRYSTRADIHLMPLHLTFSENFLIGLGSLNTMLAMSSEDERRRTEMRESFTHRSSGVNVEETRHMVAALPYALENCSGLDVKYSLPESPDSRSCLNGCKEFFRFNSPRRKGAGGWRQYGEDAIFDSSIKLFIGDNTIEIKHLDNQLGRPKRCHILDDSTVVVTTVVREGKSTVLRLAANFSMQNRTPIPMTVSILNKDEEYVFGVCPASSTLVKKQPRLMPIDVKQGTLSKSSFRLGMRYEKMAELGKEWVENKKAKVTIKFSPNLDGASNLAGKLDLELDYNTIANARNQTIRLRKDIICTSAESDDDFVFQARVKFQLIGDIKLVVNVTVEPRAQFVNTLPVDIAVLTRTRQAFSSSTLSTADRTDTIHHLPRGGKMEIYSAGDTLALKVRCSEQPVSGTLIGMSRQWIEIPVTHEMATPLLCLFPFGEHQASDSKVPGSEFYIAEANSRLPNFFLERINDDGENQDVVKGVHKPGPRTYLFAVANYSVDHTGNILFEQMASRSKRSSSTKKQSLPFSAFVEQESKRNISLLPTAEVPIRLIERGSDTERRSAMFSVEEVSMSEGGAQATPLLWDDGSSSGYFLYRRLVSSFQSELHVIPEFLVFNGDDKRTVTVKQVRSKDVQIPPLQTAPIFATNREKGLRLAFRYDTVDGSTNFLQLEELGLHIDIVRTSEGVSLGSVAVQTSIGSTDSRLVIKLGKVGSIEREKPKNPIDMLPVMFVADNLRLRVQADKMAVTLNQACVIEADVDGQGTLEEANKGSDEKSVSLERSVRHSAEETSICSIIVTNCVYDVQKMFKESEEEAKGTPERCQLSLIVHDMKIFDEMPGSPFPTVFKYSGENRFLDLCVRTKGPLYANTVKIDLLDMILAHSGGEEKNKKERMTIQTYEDFIWKLLDTADLISKASAEGAEPANLGEVDKALAAYVAQWNVVPDVQYMPPQVSTIFNIEKIRVSPFNINLSFTRTPQAERYEKFINNQGAHLMRYFTQQLKFTIRDCNLRFSPYEQHSLQGPMDRLVEILTAVYSSRIKLKAVSILAASSFNDWKSLAARDGGDDEFVDGDVLRVTGAIAGNSVAYAFNKVGRGLGKGITAGFDTIGGGIENGAALVGAKGVGSNVNSLISGVGGGIAGTFQGVGEGTGTLAKGAGKGVGHFFGGITGGGKAMVKGLGKGIVTGDHKAVTKGFKSGAKHMGNGIRQSTKAVGAGVGGGVGSVFQGPAKGVRSSVARSSAKTDGSRSSKADELAALREEFKDQDYS